MVGDHMGILGAVVFAGCGREPAADFCDGTARRCFLPGALPFWLEACRLCADALRSQLRAVSHYFTLCRITLGCNCVHAEEHHTKVSHLYYSTPCRITSRCHLLSLSAAPGPGAILPHRPVPLPAPPIEASPERAAYDRFVLLEEGAFNAVPGSTVYDRFQAPHLRP